MASERSIEIVVGERLRSFRRERGLTQRELTRRVAGGLDLSYISRIERGEQLPSLKVLQKLATALGVPAREFFNPEPVRGAKVPPQEVDALWRALHRVPRKDLPIVSAVVRALARRSGESSRYSVSGAIRRVAAERRRPYRKGNTGRSQPR